MLLSVPSSIAESESAFLKLLDSVQSVLGGSGLRSQEDENEDSDSGGDVSDLEPSARDYWISEVDPIAQSECKRCHQTGGIANNARLKFTSSAEDNHFAMQAFVGSAGASSDLVLSKIRGAAGHGGGVVISPGSPQYQVFEQYFVLLQDGTGLVAENEVSFWEGVVFEDDDTTLRRGSLLLSGAVARPEAIERVKLSENNLRGELLKLMRGENFHDFLISGADDRLLTDGLVNGSDFSIRTEDRFPAFVEFLQQLPKQQPQTDYYEKPFLNRDSADWEFRWAIHREPLELIAHVVMSNQSYKEILTADYTMVNPISAIAYRSDVEFDVNYTDKKGFYERNKLNTFKPGRNNGHIPHDEEFHFDYDERLYGGFSGYQQWPHAGILSTHAWLARYPS